MPCKELEMRRRRHVTKETNSLIILFISYVKYILRQLLDENEVEW